ncbi:MAG TPA: hypothetical protein VGR37_18105 [Longimicrobiaceae bacterium]|nr:hypothetical protein [Longimicrobiaceae bacterium]
MRIVRTAAFVLLFSTLCACGAGITGPDALYRVEQSTAGAIEPEPAAPRLSGGYIGSGT